MDELLKKFLKSEYNPFRKEPDSVIGVDIGSSSIKVVQLRRDKGVAVLETYGEIALGPYAGLEIGQVVSLSTKKIITALQDVIREANVTSKVGGISIPFTSSLVTMIRMPALPVEQLEKMIPIEARKYIPVPINEVSLDWFIVPEGDEEILNEDIEERDDKKDGQDKKKELPHTKVLLVAIQIPIQ